MRTLALYCLLGCGVLCAGGQTPADFTLVMHVIGTQKVEPPGTIRTQQLDAILNGQRLQLTQADGMGGLFALGDYPAKSMPVNGKHKSYEVALRYRLWFPDGTIHDYDVTGLGTLASPCASENKP